MTATCADCIPNNYERDVLLCPKHRATDAMLMMLKVLQGKLGGGFGISRISRRELQQLNKLVAIGEEART